MGVVQSRKHSNHHRTNATATGTVVAAAPSTTTPSSSIRQTKDCLRRLRLTSKRRGKSSQPRDVCVVAGKMAEQRSGNAAAAAARPDDDTSMADGAVAASSSSTSSSLPTINYARRRRTRSIAQSATSDDAQHDDDDDRAPRRTRRRTQGKRRAEEEQQVTEDEVKPHAESLAIDLQSETQSAQDSSGTAPRVGSSAFEAAERSHQDASASTVHQTSLLDQTSASYTPADAAHNPSAEARTDDDRRAQVRRQIAQAVRSGMAPNRFAVMQEVRPGEGAARPSILSAMLSDILGLRGGSRSMNANPSETGVAGAPSQGQPVGLGGTSVIVQGALVTRTIPSRNTAAAAAAAAATSSASVHGQSARQDHPSAHAEAASQSSSSASDGNLFEPASAVEEPGDAQAATIEEQASMLVRLMSIATAATAASLLQVPANRRGVASQTADVASSAHTGSSEGGDTSVESSGSGESVASNSSASADVSNASTQPASDGGRSDSSSTNADSASSSAWASHTLQSLRSRITSLGNRLRGRSATIRSQWPPRVAWNPSARHAIAGTRSDVTHDTSTQDAIPSAAASTLAALSTMLRDAISDGFQSNTANSGENSAQPRSTQMPSSSRPTSAPTAQSRVQSVNATLEAVRGGQLTRGEEGTFNRFLFDTASDLNFAVRGPSEGDESMPDSDEARARRQGDSNDGQLSFFRFFALPSAQIQGADSTEPSPFSPCIVIGVRSMRPNAAAAAANASATAGTATAASNDDATPSTGARPQEGPQGNADGAAYTSESLLFDRSDSPNLSRYLLFISGGHYAPQHPLFHSTRDESSRDLMVLMEFLGAMAAVQAKPSNTVTRDEIARSSLRSVNGSRTEIETLARLHQVMENTSERCLICLEDWQDGPEERRLLDCGHLFHAPCLDQWLVGSNNSCPLCRRQAVVSSSDASA